MEQKHFSLLAECLNPDLSESEQIEALLQHAEKELTQTVKLHAPEAFQAAKTDLQRAFIVYEVMTAMQSAVSRLQIRWMYEDGRVHSVDGIPPTWKETAEFREFLKTALVPVLAETPKGEGA